MCLTADRACLCDSCLEEPCMCQQLDDCRGCGARFVPAELDEEELCHECRRRVGACSECSELRARQMLVPDPDREMAERGWRYCVACFARVVIRLPEAAE